MTIRTWLSAVAVSMALVMAWGCGDDDDDGVASDADADTDADADADTDADADADGDTDADADADSDADTDFDCWGDGVWYDEASELCWQDPPSDDYMNWYRASGAYNATHNPDTEDYCGDLVQGGHSDWHLPNIDELITLLRGCQNGTATGDLSPSLCEMTPAGCAETDTCDGLSTCSWCEWDPPNGPGSGGCYWDPALSGTCSWYWSSSSRAASASASGAWAVTFTNGNVPNLDKTSSFSARCVRSGP